MASVTNAAKARPTLKILDEENGRLHMNTDGQHHGVLDKKFGNIFDMRKGTIKEARERIKSILSTKKTESYFRKMSLSSISPQK